MRDAEFDAWVQRARAVPIEREIDRRRIKLRGKIERVGPCSRCGGGDDRFSINTKKRVWNCRGCGIGGDVIKLVEHLDGCDFKTACTTLVGEPPPKAKANGKDYAAAETRKVVVAEFPYLDEFGAVAFAIERVEYRNADGSFVLRKDGKHKKTFRQKRPDPERPRHWIWDADGVPIIPYRLPELIDAIANGRRIIIVEGEAKVDLLWSWNVPATCCVGGAGKWKAEHSAFLRGTDVVILPDNDEPGRKHVNVIGSSLQDIATRIRVLVLPALGEKEDIEDWASRGGTVEKLHGLIECEASPWTSTEAVTSPGVSLDEFFAYMVMHNYIFVPTRDLWPASSVNARIPPVSDGSQTVSASAWLDKHKPVEQMTWAPGEPLLIKDRLLAEGGWVEHPGVACFNLYRPPNIVLGDPNKAGPWLDHLHRVFGDSAEHILQWLAHRRQRPAEKINHALVLGGAQGIGKDTALEPVKRAVGPWNFAEVSPQHMLGRFNGYLRSVILRISEARDLGEYDRFKFYDHLKSYIAAPPTCFGSTRRTSANTTSQTSAGSSSRRTTSPTASSCRPMIAVTSCRGPTSPKKPLTRSTGPASGRGTTAAATGTWPPTSHNWTSAGSIPRHPHPRRWPSGRSSTPRAPPRTPRCRTQSTRSARRSARAMARPTC